MFLKLGILWSKNLICFILGYVKVRGHISITQVSEHSFLQMLSAVSVPAFFPS